MLSKLRTRIKTIDKFSDLEKTVVQNLKNAPFFNQMKTICVYNNKDSISLNNILLNRSNYLKNTFVFPKLENNNLSFYHISDPEDLIIDGLGIKDVNPGCFKIDTNEIDVILVSGLSFDLHGNWIHADDNTKLYNKVLKKIDKVSVAVTLECQMYMRGLPQTKYQIDGFLTEKDLYYIITIQGI